MKARCFRIKSLHWVIAALDAWPFLKVRFDPVVLDLLANGRNAIALVRRIT
jgi:hypothetical protein